MTCERYGNALIDVIAAGMEPNADLRAHLQTCPACTAALEKERLLFSSIEAGLRTSVNSEIPPAYMHRVRAAISREDVLPPASSLRPSLLLIFATAAVILLIAFQALRRAELNPVRTPVSSQLPSERALPATSTKTALSVGESVAASASKQNKKRFPGASHVTSEPAISNSEIMVSPEQQMLLARYALQLQSRRNRARPLVAGNNSLEPAPLQLDLIQIAELDVKPLVGNVELSAGQ